MQVSPSPSLLQALSGVAPVKKPVVAQAPVQPVRPDPLPRSDTPAPSRTPDVQGRPRLGQVIDIRV